MDDLSRVRDRVDRLPSTGAWRMLPRSSQCALGEICTPIRAERGDSPTGDALIVVSGLHGALREIADGRRSLSAIAHAGDFLDFRRTERKRQGDLTTLAPGMLLVPDTHGLDTLVRCDGSIAALLLQLTREAFARARDHCVDIATKTPLERLASVLLELRRRESGSLQASFVLPMRRGDLAEYLGLKPETVSRGFRKLREEGFIEAGHAGLINILNLPGLRMLANGGRPRRSTRPL